MAFLSSSKTALTTLDVVDLLAREWPALAASFKLPRRALQGLLAWSRVVSSYGTYGTADQTNNLTGLPAPTLDGRTCAGYVEDVQLADRCVRRLPDQKTAVLWWRDLALEPAMKSALESGATNVLAHALLTTGFLGARLLYPTTAQIGVLAQKLDAAVLQIVTDLKARDPSISNEWQVRAPTPPVVPPERMALGPVQAPPITIASIGLSSSETIAAGALGLVVVAIGIHWWTRRQI